MMRKFIRISQLANSSVKTGDQAAATKEIRVGMVPVSPATIWRWVQSGEFPPPVKLGANTSAWPVEVVEAWLSARANEDQSQAKK